MVSRERIICLQNNTKLFFMAIWGNGMLGGFSGYFEIIQGYRLTDC